MQDQFDLAVAALSSFEELHKGFMNSIASLRAPSVNGAEVIVVGNELRATCLGVSLRTKHRPVAQHGHFAAIEYAFLAHFEEKDVVVWTMYLYPNDSLYADLSGQDAICQSGNSHLTSRIAPHLASSLLKSQVFAQRN